MSNATPYCLNATCEAQSYFALVSSTGTMQGIAVDDTYVYWADSSGNTISRYPKAAGTAEVLATNQYSPWRLAVDATALYWSNNLGGAIMTMPKGMPGTPSVLATASQPWGVAADDTSVYWTNQGDGSVMSVPKTGGAGTVLAMVAHTPSSIVVDASYLFVIGSPSASGPGVLYRIPKTGGAAQQFAAAGAVGTVVSAVTLDDVYVYWSVIDIGGSWGPGDVYREPKAGGTVETVGAVNESPGAEGALATDGCSLYLWNAEPQGAGGNNNTLFRQNVWGGPTTAIGIPGFFMTLDSTYVYGVQGNTVYRSLR